MTLAQFKEILVADMEQMKRKDAHKDGKLKIMPNDEVKEHLGRSPDFGDALMMRCFLSSAQPCQALSRRQPRALVQPYQPGLGV
jgi:hypothetical protein